jgi:hypothetical protein
VTIVGVTNHYICWIVQKAIGTPTQVFFAKIWFQFIQINLIHFIPFPSLPELITFEEYAFRDYILDNRTSLAATLTEPLRLKVAPKRNPKKKSFADKTLTKSAFSAYLSGLCPKLFFHHQLERVQRQVFTSSKLNLKLNHLLLQMDFAENLKLILLQQR